MKAAAQGLESAAEWTGAEATTAPIRATSDAQALGKRLASGGVWAKDEVEKGFDSLGTALNQLGTLTPASAKTEQPFAGSSR